jgi:nitrite reductase (NO-forming)
MVTTRTGDRPGGTVQWPKTALRVTFGVIWLIDAVLKWLPGFRRDYMDTIMGQADGQPGWLKPWFDFWINLQHPQPAFFGYMVAVVETLIAVAVILGFARKLTYSAAIVFSLLIWGTAEGFGGPYTAGAADVGTALIYALVFAGLLLFSYYAGPATHSVDHYLEQRISWWHRLAEVEPRHHRAPGGDAPTTTSSPPLQAPAVLTTVDLSTHDAQPQHAEPRHARTPAGRR